MPAKRASRFFRVGDIVSLFVQMGCSFNTAEESLEAEDGDIWGFAYLVNPANGTFVPVLDLGQDDRIPEGDIRDWQRMLGITIPLPET